MPILQRLPVDEAQLDAFCRQWKIAKLELFGSMLVDPSRAQDIDLLVTFSPEARWGLFEHERNAPVWTRFELLLPDWPYDRTQGRSLF